MTRPVQIAARAGQPSRLIVALVGLIGFVGLLLATSAAESAASRPNTEPKPTIVLVHGAWADSSGWSEVVRRLQQDDYRVIAPATPLRSLSGDSAYVRSFIEQEEGPLVLVGHSYGGAVISNAAAGNDNVEALVFINAFVPEVGENILQLAGEGSLIPSSIEFKGFPPFGPTDVDIYLKPANFRETFAADVPRREAAVMAVTQRPIGFLAGAGLSEAAAWHTIPSWYLVGRQDRAITPVSQRFMAQRAGATTREVNASHVSMISRPGVVVDLIEDAAEASD